MQSPSLNISSKAEHLCALLADWPRQVVAAWLAEHQANPGSVDIRQVKQPDAGLKRRSSVRAYLSRCKLPPRLKPFDHFALSILDAGYPDWLRTIPDPPLVLFCLGRRSALDQQMVAVVGARRCTTPGRSMAFELAKGLAENGCNIVSGLAVGIDAAAHRGALSAQGGTTTAVLGGGFGNLYPKQNTQIALQLLAAGGLLVSEYPAGVAPRPYHFPERNRIISGLSELTVLVEASEKSGSLITARLALEQGRDVCAVPGPATSPMSRGCHRLIRQGAALVTSVTEVAEELGWSLARSADVSEQAHHESALTGLSAEVCQVISEQSRQFDEIVASVGSDPQKVSQCLMELQLSGFVRQGSDGYIRVL